MTVALLATGPGCTRLNPLFGDTDGTSDASGGADGAGSVSAGSVSASASSGQTTKGTDDGDTADGPGTSAPSPDLGAASEDDGGLCGNGVLDDGEGCDLGVGESIQCSDLGFGQGAVQCVDCQIETNCCGDRDVGQDELCDPPGAAVECPRYSSRIVDAGVCSASCEYDTALCPRCGDGALQEDVEDCDFEGSLDCNLAGLTDNDGIGAVECVDCRWESIDCCIPGGHPCSLGEGIACCFGDCGGDGLCPDI
jgi:hypothetical protein